MSLPSFHDLPATAFPFTIKFIDEEGTVVESIRVDEPGTVMVPALREQHGPVTVRIQWPDWTVSEE